MKNNGITLIALVITIVVLIILAGVTLNLTLGENGIFKKAEDAKQNYQIAQEEEESKIDNYANLIDEVVSNRNTNETKVEKVSLINIVAPMDNTNPEAILTEVLINDSLFEISNNKILFKKECNIDIYISGGTNSTSTPSNYSGGIRLRKNDEDIDYQEKLGWSVNKVYSNITCLTGDTISFAGYLNRSGCNLNGLVAIVLK